MNSLAIILGYNVTIGLPEMIIFLLAAILLGFSIHFYWTGKKAVPGIQPDMPVDDRISQEDLSRLELYEEIEKHEKAEERLQSELKRMAETEKSLLRELEETRDEVARLEKSAEKKIVSEPVAPPARQYSELMIAQQHLNESLSKEMTERLEKAYEEFNFLQDRINKIHSQVIDPTKRNYEFEELEQSYFRLTKEYDELKIKHVTLMDETQRLNRLLADNEERLRDANFQKQQLSKKVIFLEELANDLQQL